MKLFLVNISTVACIVMKTAGSKQHGALVIGLLLTRREYIVCSIKTNRNAGVAAVVLKSRNTLVIIQQAGCGCLRVVTYSCLRAEAESSEAF